MYSLTVGANQSVYSNTFNQFKHNTSFKQNVTTPVINVPQPMKSQTTSTLSKTLPIVTTAAATVSTILALYAICRKPGSVKNMERKIEGITHDLAENGRTQDMLRTAVEETKNTVNTLRTSAEGMVNELRGQVEGQVNGVRNEVNNVRSEVNNVRGDLDKVAGVTSNVPVIKFNNRPVNLNGVELQLASPMHAYGDAENELTETLRGAAAKRIFGVAKRIETPNEVTIRIPTAEFKQCGASTGGLSIVPQEVAANLGAVINNKQKAQIIVDTPMYMGQVENTKFFDLVKTGKNEYNYVSRSGGKETVMAKVKKVDTMDVDIHNYTDIVSEKVDVYMTDEMRSSVDFAETLAQFDAPTQKEIKKSLAAGKDYPTSLVHFTAPKERSAQIIFSDGSVGSLVFDKIMAQFDPEKAEEINKMLSIGKICEIPVSDFIRNKGNQMEIFGDDVASRLGKELLGLQDGVRKQSAVGVPTIKLTPEVEPKAEAKYRVVFYKNRKFDMSGPVEPGKIKNIYNNQTTQSGETERFVYFGKYFYEHLLSNHQRMEKPLKADMIIGNDWHTGPIAAMTRLLTPCKKAMGDLDPQTADKIENIPIITIMHNFKLQGSANHSQGKLLNVMFGEHSAKVAENAWMPKDSDMPGHLMNGLLSGTDINPQTMAMSYADDIVFVSRGNFAEASGSWQKGGTNYQLASMRGRTHQYADRANLERMAMANGIDPRILPDRPTAKGITNGCDRVNNILTKVRARKLEETLGLKVGSLISDEVAINNPFKAHQNNKKVILEKIKDEVNMAKTSGGKENPLKIAKLEETNIAGVDENTPVFAMAGRIVDQKGIDIYAAGYEEFIKKGNYDRKNPPLFWLNGIGDQKYIDAFMECKARIREIDPLAADRMVFSGVFSEPGRYDSIKLISDFSNMSSWDEPCGLVHKEIGSMSGAISIVNVVGGLTDGLKGYVRGASAEQNKGANSIFVEFWDKNTHTYEEALKHNAEKWGDAFETAECWFNNKESFAEGIQESYTARHDWLRGKIQEYVEIGKHHGVFKDSIDSKYN